jgi:hypothetical protein
MRKGLNMMVSGDFRVSEFKTKTFGVVYIEEKSRPLMSVQDNSEKWRKKIDEITSSEDYEIVRTKG